MGPETAFRGSVVRSRLERGYPFHRVVVTRTEVRASFVLGDPVQVTRADLTRIEVARMFPGFNKVITFHTARGMLMFAPFRPKKLLATLREYGWPLPP